MVQLQPAAFMEIPEFICRVICSMLAAVLLAGIVIGASIVYLILT